MRSCITMPIAIIGVGCRLPGGVNNLSSLWNVLSSGRDCIVPIPKDRWDVERFYHPERTHAGSTVTVEAGLIDHIYDFDADFFGISPKEAESMDPQQRILLELTWEALENAGIVPSTLQNSDTAVFVGAASPDSGTIHADDLCATSPYSMTGTNLSIIANRISYIFNFHGPSFTLDTACSSSLYALHQACQTLAAQGASMAIAAGVNVLLAPYPFVGFSQAYMLSPEGRCKVFDAAGNGYVRSEGGGVLLLEPLEEALSKGRRIHAVIRAVACNSDGRTQGIALPSSEAQEELLRDLYDCAKLPPDDLSYLEAHGTGTVVGDPLEARAIGNALGRYRSKPLTVGSVKCNLGHLETASAMAGIMKSLTVLRQRRIPKQIHIKNLNPAIDFKGLNIHVPLREEALPRNCKLRIGVNSFGFGGANGHVLLEEPPVDQRRQRSSHAVPPLFLSARSEASLKELARSYASRISEKPTDYSYIANILARHRESMSARLVLEPESVDQVVSVLENYAGKGEVDKPASCGMVAATDRRDAKTAFVFAGNGCHWLGMGRDLLDHPVFSAKVREVAQLFSAYSGQDLIDLLEHCSEEDLEKTENTQPLIFLIQVGICALLEAQGIVPDVVFGHSVGEVAAVWAAGILSLQEAVRVVYYRSVCQGRTRGSGMMAAAKMAPEELSELSASVGYNEVELAGINAPGSVTLCGSERGLKAVGAHLNKRRSFFKMLPLDYAFHSKAMESIREELLQSLAGLHPKRPRIIFISSVAADDGLNPLGRMENARFSASYWWRNIRRPVLFHAAAKEAISLGVRYFLEISPHAILQQYLRSALKSAGIQGWVGFTMQRSVDNRHFLSNFWKNAWIHGWPLNPARYVKATAFWDLDLPTYPWNRRCCRIEETPESQGYLRRGPVHPLLGWSSRDLSVFENVLDLEKWPWLSDHMVGDSVFYPAAAYLETCFALGRTVLGDGPLEMANTAILRPVLLEGARSITLRTSLESSDGEIRITGRPFMQDAPWVLYSRGRIIKSSAPDPELSPYVRDPASFGREFSSEQLYADTERANMHYGPVFRPVNRVWKRDNCILASFVDEGYAEGSEESQKGMLIPPPLIDGGLQLSFLAIEEDLRRTPAPRLPFWFDRCILYRGGRPKFALFTLDKVSRRGFVCSVHYLDFEGRTLLSIFGGRARTVERLGAPAPDRLFTTDFLAVPPRLLSSCDLPLAQAEETLEAAARALAADPKWCMARNQEDPLVRACLEALVQEVQNLSDTSHLPPQLLPLISRHSVPENLPSFAELWQTLLLDAPDKSFLAQVLLAVHGRLVEGADISLAPLWQQFNARAYESTEKLVLTFVDRLLSEAEEDLPLVVVAAGCSHSSLDLRLLSHLGGHAFWLTDADQGRLEALKIARNREKAWSMDGARRNFAQWNFENSNSPAPLAHLIVAGNVLHLADDIVGSLIHIRESLLPGGVLCAFETDPSLFQNLTHGMDSSWWTQSGDEHQSVSRLLPAREWEQALSEAGFENVHVVRAEDGELRDESFVLTAMRPATDEVSDTLAPVVKSVRTERKRHEKKTDASEWSLIQVHTSQPYGPFARALQTEAERMPEPVRLTVAPRGGDLLKGSILTWKDLFLSEPRPSLYVIPFYVDDPMALKDAVRPCATITSLARAWDELNRPPYRIVVVTYGAYTAPTDHALESPGLAAVAGVIRVIMNEMPGLDIRLIDLPRDFDSEALRACMYEITHPDQDREVILRGRRRYVLRSHELLPARREHRGELARLEIDDPGHLESLCWHALAPVQPEPGTVLVKVEATGLNFRDVMWAMNLLPEEALENGFSGPGLGIECSGIVEAVGEGVDSVVCGQKVICFGSHCFSSHVLTTSDACVPMPEGWDYTWAATVPVTFFTAYYALTHLAKLESGDTLLIHGAAGGVGLAAIQIALSMGITVHASAGSPLKRHLLKMLGVEYIYDSRSLAFRDEIFKQTGGVGVDCVLNSLAGEAMGSGLQVLKPFGRFLELGKSDFFADNTLRLRPFRNNISYFGIDVDQLMKEKPALARRLFAEMMRHFTTGEWRPLPCTVFEADEVEQAFRFMQKSQHMGKVVVRPPKAKTVSPRAVEVGSALTVRRDGTYLVTGGLGGFGFESAKFLSERGAGALLLLSRSGETAKNRPLLQKLREASSAGANCIVRAVACDVSDEEALATVLARELSDLPPLRGVLHAAAVLNDSLVLKLSRERLSRVLAPKMCGAWALHKLTYDQPLDFFILYSSISTLVGNPGQANYVAANMAMESLARGRRALGLPGLAAGWGAIADTGMLMRDRETMKSLTSMTGLVPLSSRRALEVLSELPADCPPLTYVFGADFRKIANLPLARQPRCRALVGEVSTERLQGQSLTERLAGKDEEEAHDIVLAEVLGVIARILRTSVAQVRTATPLQEMGIDSLMGVELSLALEELLGGRPLTGAVSASISAEGITSRILQSLNTAENGENALLLEMAESHGLNASGAVADLLAPTS